MLGSIFINTNTLRPPDRVPYGFVAKVDIWDCFALFQCQFIQPGLPGMKKVWYEVQCDAMVI